ncbi:MAG: hypothetical protein VKK07_11420 [Merismopediaceae bacterium]|nr:hypothetical protein [Merismopediaceae bacterium]
MTDQNKDSNEMQDATIAAVTGTVVGAGLSSVVGGVGLAAGGGAIGLGMAPIAAAGTVAGTAFYGAKKAIEEQDVTAIGAAVVGAGVGGVTSAVVGGMGLAFAGTAFSVTMAPVAAVGAVLGLAGYGIVKMFEGGKDEQEDKKD